jgi:hypothetical protein
MRRRATAPHAAAATARLVAGPRTGPAEGVLTPFASARTIRNVDDLDPIDPREAERIRRRDHDADAESRGLLRPGMGKVFKQIQDSWARPSAKKPAKARHRPRP